jgi:hypothetical protein
MRRFLILISVALFLTSLTAWASSVTYTQIVYGSDGVLAQNDGITPIAMSIPKFNNTYNQLTAVTVSFTLAWSNGWEAVKNNGGNTANYKNVQEQFSYFMSGPGITTASVTDTPLTALLSGNLAPGAFIQTPTGTSGNPFISGSQTPPVGVILADFEGGGVVNYDVSAWNSNNGSCGAVHGSSNCQILDNLDLEATLKITYDYTPGVAPEPATMAFAGFGLLALGYIGRRFARR